MRGDSRRTVTEQVLPILEAHARRPESPPEGVLHVVHAHLRQTDRDARPLSRAGVITVICFVLMFWMLFHPGETDRHHPKRNILRDDR